MGTIARTDLRSLTLKERLAAKKQNSALILDISSSMNEDVEPGRTKMDAMREILNGLEGTPDIYIFSSSARRVANMDEVPQRGHGCTYMAQAIMACKLDGINSAIIVTDGDASDKPQAMEAVKNFHLRIMYVGAGVRPKFLDDLAAAGGGYCTTDDIKLTKELTTKIQGLLGPAPKSGDIQL